MSISLTFLGAAETVTGSRHLLTVGSRKFLIDCGLFQGSPELKQRNWRDIEVGTNEIEAVLITHAHIDHIGYLPRLYKLGYRGPIYCTGATSEITRLSLPDSGHLQEEAARYANKKGFSRHRPALPLYTAEDANEVCKQIETSKFDEFIDLQGGCKLRFRRAGHILGSAFIEFHLPNGEMVLFTGDMGRPNQPIIRDPEIIDSADYLLIESTYGDRIHPPISPLDFLKTAINQAVADKGMVIVPAFAIGRTQDLLYYLQQLENSGECPQIPIWVDSPMAVDATGIYSRHHEDHDLDLESLEQSDKNPLRPKNVQFVRKADQSKALNSERGPGMIIASSGMAAGGRVVHHLAQRLSDPSTQVLFVGYQAEGTMGRKLLEGTPEVSLMGRPIRVRAEIKSLGSLSAHADQAELLAWMGHIKSPPKSTFIVHGETNAQKVLQNKIRDGLGWDSIIPAHGQEFALG